MAAHEVTREADALWTLQCAYKEKIAAEKAFRDAQDAVQKARQRHQVAMRRCRELKVSVDMR